jgi:hypothetical protein
MSETTRLDRALLRRGQHFLEAMIGARIVDVRAASGAVVVELAHRGSDDDACQITVPLDGIRFWDDAPCDGSSECKAVEHIHGCFRDGPVSSRGVR